MRLQPALVGLVGILGVAALSACASAPMDLIQSEARELSPAEQNLQLAASDLVQTVENQQWVASESGAGSARRMFNQLLGQDDTLRDTTVDNVSAYLDDLGQQPDQTLSRDMSQLARMSEAVADAALQLAVTPDLLERHVLDTNISSVEQALNAARRASRFFDQVNAQAELAQDSHIQSARASVITNIDLLERSADALADRRWAIYNSPIG